MGPIGSQDGPGSREGRSEGERERRGWLMLSPRGELSRLLLLLRLSPLGALGGPYSSFKELSKLWRSLERRLLGGLIGSLSYRKESGGGPVGTAFSQPSSSGCMKRHWPIKYFLHPRVPSKARRGEPTWS